METISFFFFFLYFYYSRGDAAAPPMWPNEEYAELFLLPSSLFPVQRIENKWMKVCFSRNKLIQADGTLCLESNAAANRPKPM